jgi:hypothetical protein
VSFSGFLKKKTKVNQIKKMQSYINAHPKKKFFNGRKEFKYRSSDSSIDYASSRGKRDASHYSTKNRGFKKKIWSLQEEC